jgi:hypothetical protein
LVCLAQKSAPASVLPLATRCTPFALMAGVGVAEFTGDPAEVKVRLGAGHQRHVRPDGEWLAGLLADLEQRPEVLGHLRVTLNNLCFVRGDRLVLPYLADRAGAGFGGGRRVDEVSVRHTAAVRAAMEFTRSPVRGADVQRHLCGVFPQASPTAVWGMLAQLVAQQFLLTDVRPPLEVTDPLAHVLERLGGLPELGALQVIRTELAGYAVAPMGEGRGLPARAHRHRGQQQRHAHAVPDREPADRPAHPGAGHARPAGHRGLGEPGVSETVEGRAHRRGRTWVTHLAEHGVYARGRTLRTTETNAVEGLELVGVSAEVTLTPLTPELEALRSADDAREQALRATVHALALRRTTRRDIVLATRAPAWQVKQILAERAKKDDSPPPAESATTSEGTV